MEKLPIIGRREYASFNHLGLEKLIAKTDSGAYTSSIHCSFIEIDGNEVSCIFLDEAHEQYSGKKYTFDIKKKLKVKSSNGVKEKRCMIRTEIEILGKIFPIDLTLTDRSEMKYPVLIGRKFLAKRFLVDVNIKYQSI